MLFLHLSVYGDEYGWKGAGKADMKQSMFIVSAYEISRGHRKHIYSMANMPNIIYPSHLLNEYTMSDILRLMTPDLQKLSTGVEYVIGDYSYLVFGYVWTLLGDYPFLREIGGMKLSPTSHRPCTHCTVCQVHSNELLEVAIGEVAPAKHVPGFFIYLSTLNVDEDGVAKT